MLSSLILLILWIAFAYAIVKIFTLSISLFGWMFLLGLILFVLIL